MVHEISKLDFPISIDDSGDLNELLKECFTTGSGQKESQSLAVNGSEKERTVVEQFKIRQFSDIKGFHHNDPQSFNLMYDNSELLAPLKFIKKRQDLYNYKPPISTLLKSGYNINLMTFNNQFTEHRGYNASRNCNKPNYRQDMTYSEQYYKQRCNTSFQMSGSYQTNGSAGRSRYGSYL
jgi:hypothetical protein